MPSIDTVERRGLVDRAAEAQAEALKVAVYLAQGTNLGDTSAALAAVNLRNQAQQLLDQLQQDALD